MTGPASVPPPLPVMPLADVFTQTATARLKPVIRISDAPGVNGIGQGACGWQIVTADSYIQAISTDEILMSGQSDMSGKILQTEAQQEQLALLVAEYPNRLWLIVGHRAHRLYFNTVTDAVSGARKDSCALDSMGFHQAFNHLSGNIQPGESLKQCIKAEQGMAGLMLNSLREEK